MHKILQNVHLQEILPRSQYPLSREINVPELTSQELTSWGAIGIKCLGELKCLEEVMSWHVFTIR